MVANLPKLLPLSHPSQYYFHVPFARQSSQPNILNMFPSFSNGDRTMLLDDIEKDSCDGLGLLRRGLQLDWLHLWLRFLRKAPYCCGKHDANVLLRSFYLVYFSPCRRRFGMDAASRWRRRLLPSSLVRFRVNNTWRKSVQCRIPVPLAVATAVVNPYSVFIGFSRQSNNDTLTQAPDVCFFLTASQL